MDFDGQVQDLIRSVETDRPPDEVYDVFNAMLAAEHEDHSSDVTLRNSPALNGMLQATVRDVHDARPNATLTVLPEESHFSARHNLWYGVFALDSDQYGQFFYFQNLSKGMVCFLGAGGGGLQSVKFTASL